MLTLAQLYNLGKNDNIDIFEDISLPVGSPLNRELIINEIMLKCGMNIPMYADPFVMKSAVNIWNAKHQYTFKHVAKILEAEYSPIENKDLYEVITNEHDRTLKDNTIGTNNTAENVNSRFDEGSNEHLNQTSSRADQTATSSQSGTNQHVVEEHEGTDTTTNTTSAFNSSTYEPDNQSATLHGHKISTGTTIDQNAIENSSTNITGEMSTGTVRDHNSITNSAKNESTTFNNDKNVSENELTTNTTHSHGNVGITSNNELQIQEMSMLSKYNPYSFLAGLFENELTLCIY